MMEEPRATLSWTAYHLFSPEYCNKWKDNKLTKEELCDLYGAAICHSVAMLSIRSFWDFKLKRYDKKRIRELVNDLAVLGGKYEKMY